MGKTTRPTSEEQPESFGRPPGQLHDFPVNVRWEVTRRHPYYLIFWNEALRSRRDPPGADSAEAGHRHVAMLILGSIGGFGEPVSPATDFPDLIAGAPDPAFLAGSVQPMTFRAVVAMLIHVGNR